MRPALPVCPKPNPELGGLREQEKGSNSFPASDFRENICWWKVRREIYMLAFHHLTVYKPYAGAQISKLYAPPPIVRRFVLLPILRKYVTFIIYIKRMRRRGVVNKAKRMSSLLK